MPEKGGRCNKGINLETNKMTPEFPIMFRGIIKGRPVNVGLARWGTFSLAIRWMNCP